LGGGNNLPEEGSQRDVMAVTQVCHQRRFGVRGSYPRTPAHPLEQNRKQRLMRNTTVGYPDREQVLFDAQHGKMFDYQNLKETPHLQKGGVFRI